MSLDRIIGRQAEIYILKQASKSMDPEFIAVYGRRRVGKTHLIREFFDKGICFEIIGKHNATLKDQLQNFAFSLGKAYGLGIQPQNPASWSEAFFQLEQFLESSSVVKHKTGKRVVFFDELPWMNTPRSKFLSCLDHFWNSWGVRQRDFILIVCGSAASWMLQNIVKAKGGLHNRLSQQIRLLPFTLYETKTFLEHRNVNLTQAQIVELYMSIGGVPHYLKKAETGLSASQIIDKTCFSPLGQLRDEFGKLYASLFDKSEQHLQIIKLLGKKRQGLTRTEILELIGLQSGGSASHRLEELEESGFILSMVPFGKNDRDSLYRLSDEYSLFFLDWISPLGKRSPGNDYWLSRQNAPRRRTWSGYAFENLCLKHMNSIKTSLGIAKLETTEAPWYYKSDANSAIPGAEIDLLIDRRDNTINLCEMKFSETEFTINKKYAEDLRRKREVFRKATGSRKNIFITMITTFGVENNSYSNELVANSLTLEDLFT